MVSKIKNKNELLLLGVLMIVGLAVAEIGVASGAADLLQEEGGVIRASVSDVNVIIIQEGGGKLLEIGEIKISKRRRRRGYGKCGSLKMILGGLT